MVEISLIKKKKGPDTVSAGIQPYWYTAQERAARNLKSQMKLCFKEAGGDEIKYLCGHLLHLITHLRKNFFFPFKFFYFLSDSSKIR